MGQVRSNRPRPPLPAWIAAPVAMGAFAVLVWLELRHPLRREVESKVTRNARNLAVAALGAVTLQLSETPAVKLLTQVVERRGWGLVKRVGAPFWLEVALTIVLLDYTLYIWHILTHRAPWLWRFHLVHHVDLDMDASTALRFHFGELAWSVLWRSAQVVVIGVSPFAYSLWQTALVLLILFHHSNVRLPDAVERRLSRLLITPRLHGIHHSIVESEINSNWSSGLSIWDRLHGTLRMNSRDREVTVGVPAYRDPRELTLPKILKMPFGPQRDPWPPLRDDGGPALSPTAP